MGTGQLSMVMQHLRRMLRPRPMEVVTDRQLLERFRDEQDESAFEVLMQRHGPMVFGVCRRVLGDAHDAEDAFQATFLVLARQAGAIRRQHSVGSWLHGVAYRTALKARTSLARRRRHERQAAMESNGTPAAEIAWRELRPIIDEELTHLPEKYRLPVVLCYLEGKTNEQAAQQLGWTKGTVSGRLARARDLLRARLARRGVTLSGVVLATVLTDQAASAAVPAALVTTTLKAATLVAAGHAAAGVISTQVAALTEGVLHTMFIAKLKFAAVAVLGLTVLVASGFLTYQALGAGLVPAQEEARTKPAARSALVPPVAARAAADDVEKIIGTWAVEKAEREGKEAPEEEIKSLRIVITSKKLIFKFDPEAREAAYKLDQSKNPKVIELTADDGPAKGKNIRGLYQLEGDRLKLCVSNSPSDDAPPTELATKPGSPFVLLTLKRVSKEAQDDKPNPNIFAARNRMISQNNMKQIGIAFHNFHDSSNALPGPAIYSKDGKPLLSWRVAILPYIDHDHLYRQFKLDEPWDSEHNKRLLSQMPKLYAPVGEVKTKEPHSTFYQVFVGKGAAFEEKKKMKLLDFTDGTSNTILAVEAGEAVPWTKPVDLPYVAGQQLPKLGGVLPDGFNILISDGSVRFLSSKFDDTVFRAAITRNGGEVFDFGKLNK